MTSIIQTRGATERHRNGSNIKMTTVDSTLRDLGLEASYVKYDTEGFEREAISGTTAAVSAGASLAISVYHKPRDLWEIPLLVSSMRPGFKLYLREHGPDGIDTVLYALAV
jgi:hypothetical protein